jgi:hypothetical protein
MANVVCPSCGGSKGGFRIACCSRGCQPSIFVCEFCKGEGQVSSEVNERWHKVEALRRLGSNRTSPCLSRPPYSALSPSCLTTSNTDGVRRMS